MKIIVFLGLCLAVALAAPVEEPAAGEKRPLRSLPAVEIVDERDELGQYTLKYKTAEGTSVVEHGRLVPTADGKGKVLVYEGEYSFVGDDGRTYVTKYKSDIAGAFQPEGEHLPRSVEPESVPEASAPLASSANDAPALPPSA